MPGGQTSTKTDALVYVCSIFNIFIKKKSFRFQSGNSPTYCWLGGQVKRDNLLKKSVTLSVGLWLTCAGAVGANGGVSQGRRAARVHGRRVVVLGTASLDGSQVAVAAWSEACWHGQVRRLRVVLRMGTWIPESGLGAAVLIMMTHFQVPELERGADW